MRCSSETSRLVLSAQGGQGTGEMQMEGPIVSILTTFILERRYQTRDPVMAPSPRSTRVLLRARAQGEWHVG